MAPRPTRLALLMSAAGLGLSLPTAGHAASGIHAQEFDLQACLAFGIEEHPPCATLVAPSGASLPAATVPTADGLPPARVEADPAVPQHESVVAVAVTDDEEFVRVSNAIALIVSAEPAPTQAPLGFARSSTAEMPQARRVAPSLAAEPSSPSVVADGPADGAATTDSGERPTEPERSPEDFVLETLAAVLGAETPAGPLDSADTARAVVRQSLPDVPPPVATRSDDRHGQRDAEGVQARQSSEHAARRPVEVDVHIDIDRAARTRKAGRSVETSSEKVLLDLQAVLQRSGDGPMALNARVEPKVEVSQEEKVLDTLSQILGDRAESTSVRDEPGPLWVSPADELAPGSAAERQPARSLESAAAPTAAATPASRSALASAAEQELSSVQGVQTAPAEEAEPPKSTVFGRAAVAVAADKLDGVRGGFETAGGLKVSFGIERAVYLDGALVSTTRLNVADLSRTSAGAAQSRPNGVEAAAGTLAVIQSGSGNTVIPLALSPTSIGTLIQNSIDGRKIQTITRIDAVVNSASIMRTLNLQSSLRSAITDSLRR